MGSFLAAFFAVDNQSIKKSGGVAYVEATHGVIKSTSGIQSGNFAENLGQITLGDITIASDTTLTGNVFCRNFTINSGVTLYPNGYHIFCSGTFTNNGTIDLSGSTVSGSTVSYINSFAGSGGVSN